MVWWKKDKDKEKEKETTTPSESPSTFTDYFSSLGTVSEKFKRVDYGDSGDEYLDREAILEHHFIGPEKNTMTRTVGYRDDEEGSTINQKWDTGANKWIEVGEDYRETTTDPRVRSWSQDLHYDEGPSSFRKKFEEWADVGLPPGKFLPGGDREQVASRMMDEQLKHSKNPDDIIVKGPDIGNLKVTNVERPRDASGDHQAGKPVIYTFEDGSKWSHPLRTSFLSAEKELKRGKMRPVAYYKALYNPRGEKIAGGDLSSVGWTQVKSINDKIMNYMKKDDEWNVMNQEYKAGQ